MAKTMKNMERVGKTREGTGFRDPVDLPTLPTHKTAIVHLKQTATGATTSVNVTYPTLVKEIFIEMNKRDIPQMTVGDTAVIPIDDFRYENIGIDDIDVLPLSPEDAALLDLTLDRNRRWIEIKAKKVFDPMILEIYFKIKDTHPLHESNCYDSLQPLTFRVLGAKEPVAPTPTKKNVHLVLRGIKNQTTAKFTVEGDAPNYNVSILMRKADTKTPGHDNQSSATFFVEAGEKVGRMIDVLGDWDTIGANAEYEVQHIFAENKSTGIQYSILGPSAGMGSTVPIPCSNAALPQDEEPNVVYTISIDDPESL